MKDALFWKPEGGKARCQLCPHRCLVAEGKRGICGVRENRGGRLHSLVYGKLCSVGVDPIEKKPLFHFAPGTECLSIATVGCNLSCSFCQNSEISHPDSDVIIGQEYTPEQVVAMAKQNALPGIAYTYTEPTIAWEYYRDVMELAREEGLYNAWVSNGYINPEPARKIARLMDAINVDLKGDASFYRENCGVPDEAPVKEALGIYKKAGVWIEVTNLMITGRNDSDESVRSMVQWVKRELGDETPVHFSRSFPHFRMLDISPTPVEKLENARTAAMDMGMKHVYVGNVAGRGLSDIPEGSVFAGKRWVKED